MSRGRLWTEEQFNCPVCLDIPTDPVTIPCGHSYCIRCIADYWDSEHKKTGLCSCPECRQTFDSRPPLCRNTMLAEAVEQLRLGNLSSVARESIRRASLAAASASERGAQNRPLKQLPANVVPCDRCLEPRVASKTCLVCMASFCKPHLKPHETQATLKGHELIAPTADLAQKICPEHKYLHEFYCQTCQIYICWLCTNNQHKGHDSASTQTLRVEKQETLTEIQTENHKKLQDRERELRDMQKVLERLKNSSDSVNEESKAVLYELQLSIQHLSELIQQVMHTSGQEKITDAQQVVDKLESEISQMKKIDGDLKELVTCQDNINFLTTYHCLSSLEFSKISSVTANVEATFDPVRNIILNLRENVENLCNQELEKINKTVFNTLPFTVTEQQSAQKPGFLKLFSGIGSKRSPSKTQGPPSLPSVSVRGPGAVTWVQDRSRNEQQAHRGLNSSILRASEREADTWSINSLSQNERQRRAERQTAREVPISEVPKSQNRQSSNSNNEETDAWRIHSTRSPSTQKQEEQKQADTWSLSSIKSRGKDEQENANGREHNLSQSQQTLQSRLQPERQSDRWSLSSLLPKNRKKRQDSVKQATPTQQMTESTLPQNVLNPGLFLDSPTDSYITPAFPTLREIDIDSIQPPEPRSREEFLQYACSLTFNPSSAHRRLILSEDNTKVMLQAIAQLYPDSPERFDGWTQVLSLQPLSSNRCYWEVEWRGRGSSVGVASASILRKGSDARAGLGYNSQSWSLELSDTCCAALHANQKQEIAVTYSPRVGIFLDREDSSLSFYSVDDVLVHLYTFHGVSLGQPLLAAFGVGSGVGVGLDFAMGNFSATSDSIKICAL